MLLKNTLSVTILVYVLWKGIKLYYFRTVADSGGIGIHLRALQEPILNYKIFEKNLFDNLAPFSRFAPD